MGLYLGPDFARPASSLQLANERPTFQGPSLATACTLPHLLRQFPYEPCYLHDQTPHGLVGFLVFRLVLLADRCGTIVFPAAQAAPGDG